MPESPAAPVERPLAPASGGRLDIRATAFDRPAVRAMTEAVQDYYRALYRSPDRAPVDTGEFTSPRGTFFVGYEGDRPLAMGGWRWIDPLPEMPAARPAEIKRMYVDAAARGRGYARAMLLHLEDTAREAGADAIVLSTGAPQLEALGLYRSSGYVDVPPFGFYAAYPTAVHLGKRLHRAIGPQATSKSTLG